MVHVTVKWGKKTFEEVDLDTTGSVEAFRAKLEDLTGVPSDRQKLMCRGGWKGVLKDDTSLSGVKAGATVTLMGSAATVSKPAVAITFVEDDPRAAAAAGIGIVALPAGLVNLGNTCYANSTLQCLRYIPELTEALEKEASDPAARGRVMGASGGGSAEEALAPALGMLTAELKRNTEDSAVRPSTFLNVLRAANPMFAEGRPMGAGMMMYKQQDSDEFLSMLQSALARSLTKPTSKVPRLLRPLAAMDGAGPNVIDSLMGIDMRVTYECVETDAEPVVTKVESSRKLVCNIQGGGGADVRVDHLHQGLELSMEGTVEKHSDVLGRNAVWKRKSTIARLPRYIVVQFMRFFWKPGAGGADGTKCKILRPVSFPLDKFDIFPFCDQELQSVLKRNREAAIEAENRAREARMSASAPESGISSGGGAAPESAMSSGGGAAPESPLASAAASGGGARKMDVEDDDDDDGMLERALRMSMAADGADETYKIGEQEVTPFGPGVSSDFTGNYECFGVVTHKGLSADSGHYMGWIRDGADRWLVFDDDEVSETNSERVKTLKGGGDSDMAYFAFYRTTEK